MAYECIYAREMLDMNWNLAKLGLLFSLALFLPACDSGSSGGNKAPCESCDEGGECASTICAVIGEDKICVEPCVDGACAEGYR